MSECFVNGKVSTNRGKGEVMILRCRASYVFIFLSLAFEMKVGEDDAYRAHLLFLPVTNIYRSPANCVQPPFWALKIEGTRQCCRPPAQGLPVY